VGLRAPQGLTEGRAPHARKGGITPTPTLPPLGSPASRQLLPNHDPPRFTSSLAKRTHRVRPFEKTASRVVPGLSPLGCPCKARPRLGGAGSARPARTELASPGHVHPGPSVLQSPPAIMTRLGLRPASPRGRTECVPPRKRPLASSGPFPARRPTSRLASPRRGGLRTPARKASRQPQHCPFWGHRPLANSCLIMTPSVYVQPCQTDAQSASL